MKPPNRSFSTRRSITALVVACVAAVGLTASSLAGQIDDRTERSSARTTTRPSTAGATGVPSGGVDAAMSGRASRPAAQLGTATATTVTEDRGTPATSPDVAGPSFGIAAGSTLPTLPVGVLNARLAGMAGLGVTWVRFDVEWSNIGHAGPGEYDWGDYDRVVRAVVAHGMSPLGILDYTPGWARSGECTSSPVCHPRSAAEFGRFAGAAAAHYAPMGLRAWEIWNEPNLSQFYAPQPDPAGYTALLKAAYGEIKSADPDSTVITGGTAPTQTASDGSTVRSTQFLSGVYAAGGQGYFDAVAHHPYTFPYSPTTAYPGGAWSDLFGLHTIMASKGDGAKKVWASEYGAPTGGAGTVVTKDAREPYQGTTHVSEALQATIAINAVTRYRRIPWAGPLFWYSYQDAGTADSTIENFFGLVRADGSHKPAYDAYRSAIGRP